MLRKHDDLVLSFFHTGVKCPVCSKVVISEDIELHLVLCLTKPRLSYNGKINIPFLGIYLLSDPGKYR